MDISNYQVDLSDYNYLTKDIQNNPKLRKTIEKNQIGGAERVSQQTLTESYAKKMQDTQSLHDQESIKAHNETLESCIIETNE